VEAEAAPGLIPLISAIPKLIYDIAAEKTDKKLKALKKSASSSYSVDFIIPNGMLDKFQCLIVVRHDKDLNINAALVYVIELQNDLLSLAPKLYWAKNTTANTKKAEEDKKEIVTFMSGVSLQGIGKQENGIPILASSGQDSKKLGKFELGNLSPEVITNGVRIGPVPIINNSSASILRVSVTETGDVGFDIDERIAANKTIREAVGPALAAGVKAYLEDE
ncbi:MAG: hypothetical protein AB2601_20930, partial [Candidatus Thiodiazotropha sp.]